MNTAPISRTINLRAVLILTVAALVFGVSVHFVHGYQVKRNARDLLEQAGHMEQEDHLDQAADVLGQYLGMMPADNDALARYGLLLDRLAKNGRAKLRALLVLNQALNRDREQIEARRQAARIALEVGWFKEAKVHLEVLLTNSAPDAELLHLLARSEVGARQFENAAEQYVRAIQLTPKDAELCQEYALLLRERLDRPDVANSVIEGLIAQNGRAAPARLAAARYYLQFGMAEKAEVHTRFLLTELAADDADVLLLAAAAAQAQKKLEEARTHLERGLKRYPQDTRLSYEMARLEIRAGERKKAAQVLEPRVQAHPTKPDELANLANLLLDTGERDRALTVIQQLRETSAAPAVDYLEARARMQQGDFGKARPLLEKASKYSSRAPEQRRAAELLLAECYRQLSNPDERLRACRRALESDPRSVIGRRELAGALVAADKLDQAIAEYRKLVASAPELRETLAGLLLVRNLRLPPAEQSWNEVEQLVKEMADGKEPVGAAALMQARILAAQDKVENARALLETERQRDPKQVGPWIVLASLARKQGKNDAALSLLDQAEREAGRHIEWELARVRLWARAGQADARRELAKIEQRLPQLSQTEQDALRAALAEGYVAANDAGAAERLWGQLAESQKGNLDVRFALLARAIDTNREAEARGRLEEMRQIEGGRGALTAYGEAALHVLRLRQGDKGAAAEAHRCLKEAAALRPSWTQVPLLRGQLYELEGDKEKAIEQYKTAVEHGEGRLDTIRRLSQLLYEQGRLSEAAALVHKLPEQAFVAPDLGRLAVQLTIRAPDSEDAQDRAKRYQKALELARQTISEKAASFQEYLWLGEVAALAGEPQEAEKAFRRARQLAANEPGPWVALVRFLSRTNAAKVEAELDAARKLPADKAPLVLARCYETLGHMAQAEEQYRTALAARPNDHVSLAGLAALYGRTGQMEKEEPCLRKLLDPKTAAPGSAVDPARRQLAILLAGQGGVRRFREALALVEEDVRLHGQTFDNRFLRGKVLATQPAHRTEAISLLAALSAPRPTERHEIHFLLGKLYEWTGDWRKAKSEFRAILAEDGTHSVYLAHYIRSLLREGENAEAQLRFNTLAANGRRTPEIVLLQTRVLQATGKSREAAALLRIYAEKPGARLDLVGELFERLGEAGEAESAYRRHLALNPSALAKFLLARQLARRGRIAEAVGLCEDAWPDASPEMAADLSVIVLQIGRAGAAERARIERRITDALRKHPDNRSLAVSLAALAEQRGEYVEAQNLYRKVLRQDPANAKALANLASLLVLSDGDNDEAARMVEKALDVAGPQAALLDTQALVHLQANRPDKAIRLLRQAILQMQSPTYYFHLARSYSAAGDRAAALQAWRRAVALGLKPGTLHLLEFPAYRQLAAELGGS